MKINEVSKLTGVTVRTLHYYDENGLLKPSEVTSAGYRLYNDEALEYRQEHFDRGESIINGSELLDKTYNYEEWL